MASAHARKNKAGEVTSWQVKWRLGGGRSADWQTESFDDETSAGVFRDAVNEAGQLWPAGWVKGVGYIDPAAGETDETRYSFRKYALACVENKTGIEEQYRKDCVRDLERWIFPTFATCDVRSVEHFSHDTVQGWVRVLEQTKVTRGQLPKNGKPKWRKMSPKTIRNLHGLLSSVLQRAVTAEPPLRARNPCELTRLPRADDDGAEGGEDIEFLTPDEVEGVIGHMERRSDQLLAIIKYGTGLRWGEISALAPECLVDWDTNRPKIRVKRAWKKDGDGGYYVGVPKSKRSRRTLRVSQAVVAAVNELSRADDKENPGRLYFTGDHGRRFHYSTYYDRWQRAVKRAVAALVMPKQKKPTPHDLRHSHAAVLISQGRGLTYVQHRLGHESIKTTSDTYGHLLPQADDDAMEAIDESLGYNRPAGTSSTDALVVHVAVMPEGRLEGFWNRDVAGLLAAVWRVWNTEDLRIEPWPVAQWQRQVPGGTDAVRSELPAMAQVWQMGPAVYGRDGSEQAGPAGAHELRQRWVWEWDAEFTTAPARWHAEYRSAPSTATEAAAWGVDPGQVRKVYVLARSKALKMCGSHPGAGSAGGPPPSPGSGARRGEASRLPVVHTDS